MGLLQKLYEHKEEFYQIFDDADENYFITAGGRITYDETIESHLRAWEASRINGVSATMAFYAEETEAIKLIDKLAKEYFSDTEKKWTNDDLRAAYDTGISDSFDVGFSRADDDNFKKFMQNLKK